MWSYKVLFPCTRLRGFVVVTCVASKDNYHTVGGAYIVAASEA